jgi:putative ABC transport system permease protein
MTAPWRKAIRDFWRERMRSLLVVLAIAVGLAGFAAVMASYAILTRELNAGYLATNPASATLRTDAVDDELLRAVKNDPGVRDAEARRTLSARIRAGHGRWRTLVLFVVQDFGNIRVSKLLPQEGAWPPAAGEILIERDAFHVAKARIGDRVIVRTTSGNETTLRLSGSVHDVGQAQARMENIVYGYITAATLERLGEQPFLDQLQIVVTGNAADAPHIRSVAAGVKELLESRGHPVRRVDVPPPGKHPHADLMGLLLLAMSSFGLFVLLLSGILVVNLLTALMASQVRQIGVMKAIGGSRWQIARIYLSQALLLGVAAIAVALPFGIWGSRLLCRYLAVFLNFDLTSFAIPAWVYLLVMAVGLVAPLLSAAWPVWHGTRVPVREALDDFGVSAMAFGTGTLDRLLAGMGGATRPVLLAIRNSFRRRTRLALTLLTLAAGGLFFMSALNIRASMIHTLDHLFDSKRYDLMEGLGTMQPVAKVARAIKATPGIVRADYWVATEGMLPDESPAPSTRSTAPHGASAGRHRGGVAGAGERFTMLAVPAGSDFIKLEIVQGRDLRPGETDALVMNSALAAKLPRVKVGDTISLRMGPGQSRWRVVGIARELFSPAVAYVPLAFFDAFHPGMTNNVRLVLTRTDAASIDQVRDTLEHNLEREQIRAPGSLSKADSRYGFDQHMLMIYIFLIVMSCIIGGVGGLGLMTTMSLNVLERRREMGVLRAIGASPAMVWLVVVAEGCVIGVLSWALAALAAWPVSRTLGNLMVGAMFRSRLDFSFEISGLLIWLGVSLTLAAIASFLPAWHASRGPIREALGYE